MIIQFRTVQRKVGQEVDAVVVHHKDGIKCQWQRVQKPLFQTVCTYSRIVQTWTEGALGGCCQGLTLNSDRFCQQSKDRCILLGG